MEEKDVEQMKKYLKLKQIQEDDKSDELIEEIYNETAERKIDKKENER